MAAHRAIRYAALGMVAGLMAAAQTAEASLVVYEGFQYNTGATGSADTGGMGWTGAWSAGGTITSPGLESTPQTSNDNAVTVGATMVQSYSDIVRSISTSSMSTLNSAGTYYVSYLFNLQYSDRNASFDLGLTNGSTSVLAIGVLPTSNSNGDFNIDDYSAVSNSTISPYTSAPGSGTSSTNIASQTTFLLVAAIDPGAGTASLYINPGSTQPAQPDASLTGITGAELTELGEINTVELFAGDGVNQSSEMEFDEIKMGTTFADVAAPEPATVTLLALSAAGLMLRRRRDDASTILVNTPAEPLSI